MHDRAARASADIDFDSPSADQLHRRRGAKWARYPDDVLAAWVADMDFPLAPEITARLAEMVSTGDLGYPFVPVPAQLVEVFVERMARRFGLLVTPERVVPLVTVVQGLDLCVMLHSEPGDGVVVQTPIYPPFLSAVERTGRRLLASPLVRGPRHWEIDFDHLESLIDARTRMLMLCNPHNPTGRVFDRSELERLAALAIEHDLVVVADEIHAELTYAGTTHLSIAALGPEIAARTVTLTSATKSFNLAGLPCAFAAFGSAALQEPLSRLPPHLLGHPGTMGIQATLCAWTEAQEWSDRVLAYLDRNRRLLGELLALHLPQVDYSPPEATYLAWLDCRALELDDQPARFFFRQARVALSSGTDFGPPGDGFARLNFATSSALLSEIVQRMAAAVERRAV